MKHYTRFRAYKIGVRGSSFSLSVDNHFTLFEAVLNDVNRPHIDFELSLLGKKTIDTLHITSWDTDHCKETHLQNILNDLKPKRIEYPSYSPATETATSCKKIIDAYGDGEKVMVTPRFVSMSLSNKKAMFAQDLFFNPLFNGDSHNDNSVVKFFRIGTFTVLSLGDCESEDISKALLSEEIITKEVDVLILAHHGSGNSICTKEFLRIVNPKVAICSSDYDNQFGHPDAVIRQRLNTLGIPLFTTKTGDVIAQSIDKYNFKVANYISDNEKRDSVQSFTNKTYYIADLD